MESMKDSVTLYFKSGSSDKMYTAAIEPAFEHDDGSFGLED